MAGNNRLGDKVRVGTTAECAKTFLQMAENFRSAGGWTSANVERNDKTLTLFNLLAASVNYLDMAAKNIEEHISAIALATRSLYEINLQARDIPRSSDSLLRWQGEAVTDKIQVLEGILGLETSSAMPEQRKVLLTEVDRLLSLRKKYGLPDARPSGAGEIAKSAGLAKEHSALFKLFSKLIHLSSYLINDYKNAASNETAMILQIHAQLYAWDTFRLICDAVSMPESARRKLESAPGS